MATPSHATKVGSPPTKPWAASRSSSDSVSEMATGKTSRRRLVEVSQIGLDGDELREAIATSRYDAVIDENRRIASSAGIDAIPAHIFGRRFLVLGAQPYEVLKQVVDRVGEPA